MLSYILCHETFQIIFLAQSFSAAHLVQRLGLRTELTMFFETVLKMLRNKARDFESFHVDDKLVMLHK